MATEADAQQLAGELLGEISQDVFDLTGGDRYRAGQPLLADPSVEKPAADGPPVSEQADATATEAEPAAAEEKPAEETPRDEKGRFTKAAEPEWFLPGLYKTKEEAIKGIHETKRYASEALDKAKAAERPAEPEPAPDPLLELENYGVPKEVMAKAISEGSRQALQHLLEPMAKRIEADRKIVSMYPDYGKNFEDLAAFVESQPELMQKVNRAEAAGEFLLARELAWLNYERFTTSKAAEARTTKQVRQVEKAKETMVDAAVTKPSQAETRTRPTVASPNDIPDEKFTDLLELAKAGYPTPLWKSTIGAVLEREYPSVFGPQPTP